MRIVFNTTVLLGCFAMLPVSVSAGVIPGTTVPVETLAADLEWTFTVEKTNAPDEPSGVRKDLWRFKSKAPYSVADGERLFLRFSLTVYQYGDAEGASQQFAEWARQGEKPTGLTYAWTRILRQEASLYRLDIPCTFSKPNVEKIAAALTRAILGDAPGALAALYCVCGGSCVAGDHSAPDGFREITAPASMEGGHR